MLRAFGIISFICSLLGGIVAGAFYSNDESLLDPIAFFILELGLLVQVTYSLFALDLIKLAPYESSNTLDNDWLFDQNGQATIRRLPPILVSTMVIATIVWTFLGIISFSMIEWVFGINGNNLNDWLAASMILIGMIGVVPTILFNLKTWNYKGLENHQ